VTVLIGVCRLGDRRVIADPVCGDDCGGLTCTEPKGHPWEHISAQQNTGIVLGIWYSKIQRALFA
jgi:hypothetical protein